MWALKGIATGIQETPALMTHAPAFNVFPRFVAPQCPSGSAVYAGM
jgi:hypothetical protein